MSAESEIRVNSWNELQDRLFEGAWRPSIQRFRSPFAFRGVQQGNHSLDTTLARLGGDYAGMERHLLRNFIKYAHRKEVEDDTVWSWLSLAKHHGLPNRLLDWSFSPFVALHFATAEIEKFDQDGAVWAVNYVKAHQFLPERLRSQLNQEGSDVFTVDMLAAAAPTLSGFDHLAETAFVVFFEPPSIDERIVNQYALFSTLSNAQARMDEWLPQHPDVYRRITIPAGLKWEIRDKLDQANITERVLFPGLDGLCAWLKRQYSPRR